jgi:selenocysteine lyase/cysteine desulfurase
MPLYANTHSF